MALITGAALIHRYAARHRVPHSIVVLCYVIPALGGVVLAWGFVLHQGQTLAQAAIGDARTYMHWSVWVGWWPAIALAQVVSGVGNLLWLLASFPREQRRWLPVPWMGAGLSGFALFVVFAYAPTS